MSDDRGSSDDYGEYGSLFDESPRTGQMPSLGGGPPAPSDEFDDADEDWEGGFGDVTWADDVAPDAVDQTLGDNYQPPSGDAGYGQDPQSTNVYSVEEIAEGGAGPVDGRTIESPALGRERPISDEYARDDLAVPDDSWSDGRDTSVLSADPDGEHIDMDHDVDVWSSFSSDSPVWHDDSPPPEAAALTQPDPSPSQPRRVIIDGDESSYGGGRSPREPGRISIGTDPSGARGEPLSGRVPRTRPSRGGPAGDPRRRGRPGEMPGAGRPGQRGAPAGGRDLPMAIAVGGLLAGLFVAVLTVGALKYWGVVAMVTAVIGLAAVEFYGRVAEKGYRPAVVPGIITCVAAPLVAYWMGDAAVPLVLAFGFIAVSVAFIGARSADAGPMPNVSITTLGIVWIGLLGSYAMLILRFSTANASDVTSAANFGTDTLFLLALGVVANDTGALLVGSFVGRTPLRPWISPNKTVEGLIGGTAFTIIVLILSKSLGNPTTWTTYRDLMLLAIVISVMAPLGDLVESMFKRNMDIKDFGTIVRGHGGVLDRFDGFLFALPAVYYLTEVLRPWTKAG